MFFLFLLAVTRHHSDVFGQELHDGPLAQPALPSMSLVQMKAVRRQGSVVSKVSENSTLATPAPTGYEKTDGFCRDSSTGETNFFMANLGGRCQKNPITNQECWNAAADNEFIAATYASAMGQICWLYTYSAGTPDNCPPGFTGAAGSTSVASYEGSGDATLAGLSCLLRLVSATEDPHMSNIAGTRFNVLRPGTYTFVELPRGAKVGEHQLFISARVDQLLGNCQNGGLYVQSMNVSGSLLHDAGPLTFDAVSKQTDMRDVLHVTTAQQSTTANEFAKGNFEIATFSQPNPNRQNLKLGVGNMEVNIAGRRREDKKRKVHIDFLDLTISGLRAYKDVGGLLGNDDHTFAATAPPECNNMLQFENEGDAFDSDKGSFFTAN